MKNQSKFFSLILLFAAGVSLSAGSPKVIATTSWTAAFVSLAGAEDMEVLAPYDMKHPPEYEISLTELQKVAQADFVIFAGYEAMMKRIKESLGENSSVKLIQIQTVNSYPVIAESVGAIASSLGTEKAAEKNLQELRNFLEDWKNDLSGREELSDLVVHFHQQEPVKFLGLEPALIFGPAPPSLTQIRDVLKIKPAVIIDNLHNPVATAFEEQTPRPGIVQWINFPGTDGTVSLLDVFKYNRRQLDKVLK